MRAIDADRLQKRFDEKSTNPNYRVNMHNIKSIINNAPTVEAIPKDQYEVRLKADMVAMLTEIQLELDEMKITKVRSAGVVPYSKDPFRCGVNCSKDVIQQKINALKEQTNET